MRKALATLGLILLAATGYSQQAYTGLGEALAICRTWDGTDVLAVNADGSLNAICSDGAGAFNVIVDSGSITCNAGTNLNTSALLTTAQHDAAFGTAGAADAQVRSVQGIAGGTALPVSGTFFQATQPVSIEQTGNNNAVDVLTIAAGDTDIGNVDLEIAGTGVSTGVGASGAQTLRTATLIHDGTDTALVSAGGALSVDPGTVTVTATNLDVQIGGSDSLTIGTFPDNEPFNLAQIVGQAPTAHDTAIGTAPPILIGGVSETPEDSAANSDDNIVTADGEATRLQTDRYGSLFVRYGPPHRWSYHENSSSALTDTTVHASCGTGLFNYIESITASTGGATAFSLMIEDSTTTAILGPYYLEAVAGRGFHVTYPGGKKQTNSATLISVTTTGAVAHGIDIIGFCAP